MPRRSKHEILARRHQVSELYLKSYSQSRIAEMVGVSRTQVTHDLKKIHEQWLKDSVEDVDKIKQRELIKIDRLEQTYWEAWEKSIEDYKQRIIKSKGKPGAKDPELQEQISKDMLAMGNPEYLKGIERCIQMRCKIIGIEAPQVIHHTGNLFLELMKKASQQQNNNQSESYD